MGSVRGTRHAAHRADDAAAADVRDDSDVFAKGRQGREYPVFLFAHLFVMMT
ncbi:hypothetical protein [Burkholderia ubonensis]|uniref:hypothetical protein n=1 Tax=Burkholderia ubonensis TaxID=101571 RepID=UPI000AAB0800|nr:hypothetical protein [Burkholderia ubonensis]